MSTRPDRIDDPWGARTPFDAEGAWPARVDERTRADPERWVASACVLCSNGCGCEIGVRDGRIVGVRGRAHDPSNRGRLGPKGLHGWEANHSAERLTTPLLRRHGRLQPVSWEEAMQCLVERTRKVRAEAGGAGIGLYTSGQLLLEEYYTLSLIGKAGLCTPHMDGNTRLCTATAAAALKESFGCDGQPASAEDIDATDCLLLAGHNMAATDTVLWSRVLDRRRGARPPRLIVIDPRATPTAREADWHLAPRPGTNVALLNGLLHLLIAGGHADRAFVDAHTLGFQTLAATVAAYPPERVQALTGVDAAQLRAAAEAIAASRGLVSTCLQGVYQSHQATAAAVQVNNLHLILGRIGRPGSGVLQMNGQPTSQNTRETGADGELPGFRNWLNPDHVQAVARLWNVDAATLPHWVPPTHALQMLRLCETGDIRLLWIQATNPAVSLPHLERVRALLQRPGLFVVVQDAFLTETAQLADLVLPAALWGEKTGTFTSFDRTVHLTRQAVAPPGQARADLDIFLDFARRMDFRDRDGAPLVKWRTAEEAFEAWKDCSRGRPCDYTGIDYARLEAEGGIRWPVTAQHPRGAPRLYAERHFPTDPDTCQGHGHDLATGAEVPLAAYRALRPDGRALLKAAEFQPPPQEPDVDHPLLLSTGRELLHFHTRTKTGRAAALAQAAPDAELCLGPADAARLLGGDGSGVRDGDWLRVASHRGAVEARARLDDGLPAGQVFLSFHHGYWDDPGRARAANELTGELLDPVSKQPQFKRTAVRLERIDAPRSRQPQPGASALAALRGAAQELVQAVRYLKPRRDGMALYLTLLQRGQQQLARGFAQLCEAHPLESDLSPTCVLLAAWSEEAVLHLQPFVERCHGAMAEPPADDMQPLQHSPGGQDLLRDLHNLWLLAQEGVIPLEVLQQAACALHDAPLQALLVQLAQRQRRQAAWLLTRIRHAAPQWLPAVRDAAPGG